MALKTALTQSLHEGVSMPFVGCLLLGLVSAYALSLAFYRCFLHPLSKYPGPLVAKLSPFYMIWHAVCGRNTFTRHKLHQKYGSVVRVGPNELAFSDTMSIKDIYGQSSLPCMKAPYFYKGFSLTGDESVFSTINRHDHGRMRRHLAHGFSQNGVLHFEPDIAKFVDKFLSSVQETSMSSPTGQIDLFGPCHSLFLDTTSYLGFAKSFDTLSGRPNQGAEDIETYFSVSPVFGIFPFARYLPFGPFAAARNAQPRIIQATQSWIDELRGVMAKQQASRDDAPSESSGFLRLMVSAKDSAKASDTSNSNTGFSEGELIENAVLFVTAGSSTSATTLLYMLYEAAKQPHVQSCLEEEVRGAFPDRGKFPTYEVANKLPYLNGVMQEALRLRGPLNSVAPRISPGKMIGETYVPAGVIVSNLSYTTHRDPKVFTDPDRFDPARWDNPTPEMKAMARPFSVGPRNCLGMHVARVQVLLTVCALYQRFDLKVVTGPKEEESMALRDYGLMGPIGKTIKVCVSPRD